MLRTIQVRAENNPGALLRITGVLTAQGLKIASLSMRPEADNARIAQIRVTAEVAPQMQSRVVNEIHQLVHVLEVRDLTPEPAPAPQEEVA